MSNVRVSPKLQELQEAARIEPRGRIGGPTGITMLLGCVLVAFFILMSAAG